MIQITKLVLAGTLLVIVFVACVSAASVEEPLTQARTRINKIMAESRLTPTPPSTSAFSTMGVSTPVVPPAFSEYNNTNTYNITNICPSYLCVLSQGDCYAPEGWIYLCPKDEYYNETLYSCNCRRLDQFFKYGDVCDPYSEWNQCGPRASCLSKDYGQTYHCVAERHIGDKCDNDYDCDEWRICVDGKCAANLKPNAECWNSTFLQIGICPIDQYCPSPTLGGLFQDYYNCTSYPKLDQPCDFNYGCVPPWICGASGTYDQPTCGRVELAYIPNGQPASNLTAELSCVSLLSNYSSGLCVSYEDEKIKWENYYKTNTSCTADSDCNLYGVNIAICHCSQYAENNTAYCVLDVAPDTFKPLLELYLNTTGPLALGFKAGCEKPLPYGEDADFDKDYCYTNYSTEFLYAYCYVTGVYQQQNLDYDTFSCYEQNYCNISISSNYSSSSGAVYYPSTAPPVSYSTATPPPPPVIYSSSAAPPPVVYSSSATPPPPVIYSSSAVPPPVVYSSSATPPPPVIYSSSATPPPPVIYSSSAAPPPPVIYSSSATPPPPVVYSSSAAPPPPVVYSSSATPPPPPVVYSSSAAPPPVVYSSSAAPPPPVVYSSSATPPPPPILVYSSSASSYGPYAEKGKFKTQAQSLIDPSYTSGANTIPAITAASVLFTCAAIVALIVAR